MNRRPYQELQEARSQLQSAEAELEELDQQIASFEAQVDSRLGNLLDQLSALNAEIKSLNETLVNIREQRLYGEQRMRYMDGAPRPGRQSAPDDLPPLGVRLRKDAPPAPESPLPPPELRLPDIKMLYRKLARRYHPDLAQSEAERTRLTEQMAEINQAYSAGDLGLLMSLAGMSVPFGVQLNQPPVKSALHRGEPLSELEQVQLKLKDVRQKIARLSSLPSVKLSLEVKLARRQGRDLLMEMASDLQRKLARKSAERDYLRSQIKASGAVEAD
jgi:DNA repair exonuclease SbcCD ATPase subunit